MTVDHDLVRALRSRDPDGLAVRFLLDGAGTEAVLSAGALLERAGTVAAHLHAAGAAGQRVVLLYPPGLDYIVGFYGCLLAGAVPVPLYPPKRWRPAASARRIRAVVADCGARIALTDAAGAARTAVFVQAAALPPLHVVDTSDLAPAPAPDAPAVGPGDVAFLQYTSGSTGTPRGVRVTFGNLAHNLGCIDRVARGRGCERGLVWLPPYHDMGLIGGILHPVTTGMPVTLMSPLHFLQRPHRWLAAIARYRIHASSAPDFAYAHCVRRVRPAQLEGLDLSCWRLSFDGAEPIDAAVVDRFADLLAPTGFDRRAIYPCYGLAEATLIATGADLHGGPRVRRFDPVALAAGRAEPGTRALVSCGTPVADTQLAVVHPDTAHALPEGRVGEVWLRGPSVADGYWGGPDRSEGTFGAYTAAGEGPYLRTGDLGTVVDGELYFVGRTKDVIVVAGRNHAAHDLERTAAREVPDLRAVCAFGDDDGGPVRVVVLAESTVDAGSAEGEAMVEAVRRAILRDHGLAVHHVGLVRRRALVRTTSGKLARGATRSAWRASAL